MRGGGAHERRATIRVIDLAHLRVRCNSGESPAVRAELCHRLRSGSGASEGQLCWATARMCLCVCLCLIGNCAASASPKLTAARKSACDAHGPVRWLLHRRFPPRRPSCNESQSSNVGPTGASIACLTSGRASSSARTRWSLPASPTPSAPPWPFSASLFGGKFGFVVCTQPHA